MAMRPVEVIVHKHMDASRFLTCARCSRPIGAYEPVWWRRPDGSLSATGYLRVRDDPRFHLPGSAYFHERCLDPSCEPATM
jgi:hypothetical protein